MNTWLLIYLVGCAITLILILTKMAIYWGLSWMTKSIVFRRNVEKIQPPKEESRLLKMGLAIGMLIFEVALSWINVPIGLWQIGAVIVKTMREVFTPVPEKIKELRFPLYNNPNLERESVWAYLASLRVSAGEIISTDEIVSELKEIRSHYPSFSFRVAIKQLERIGVVRSDLVARAASRFNAQEKTYAQSGA
jgi:hypothetical protein